MIGRLQRVPLREVRQHQALHFTSWLERNVDVLKDAPEITHSGAEREQSAGALFFAHEGFDEEVVGRTRLTLAGRWRTISESAPMVLQIDPVGDIIQNSSVEVYVRRNPVTIGG